MRRWHLEAAASCSVSACGAWSINAALELPIIEPGSL